MLVPLQDRARVLRMAKLPIRYRPGASADDGTAGGNAWDSADQNGMATETQLLAGDFHTVGGYSYRTGIRFTYPGGIQLAKGQHIKAARIRFCWISLNWPNFNVLIRSEPSDNALAFATYSQIWQRTRGTASIPWDEWPLPKPYILTPDIAPVIQEVIDRPGWVKGNALAVFLDATGASGQPSGFNAESWNTTTFEERRPWLYIWL